MSGSQTVLIAGAVLTSLVLNAFSADLTASDANSETIEFNRDVRPILADACFACHGPDPGRRKADQRFDTEAGLVAAREVKAIVPGSPDASEMIARITSSDSELRMPPPSFGKRLTPDQISIIRRWIEQGAKWQQHWAYLPPKKLSPPVVEGAIGAIDRFVLDKILREGVTPTPPADRATLIRRLSLDLIGLPPAPNEVEAFLADKSPRAIERVVDRLLKSPHFGERMALYWLDLVRYADSVGYHKDSHRNVWLYRDYVINAFNDNIPFDRFVTEQLAGDLLPGTKYAQFEWKTASGFNRMNQTTSEGGAQAKEYLAKYAADRVRNTSAIFLGSTMGCTECHDHKYDPFTTKDFYSFAAFFSDIQERGVGFPKETPMPSREQVAKLQQLEAEIESLKSKLASKQEENNDDVKKQIDSLVAELAKVSDQKTWAKTIISESGKSRVSRILPRGNWLDDSGPVVEPAVPEFLGSLDVGDRRATRLDLAQWIASRDNPLTARVFVNRLWKLFFGRGISRTLDDVGSQGQWPTHPRLLDWLAVEFIESGWDMKHMVKLLVMSDTYRRGSNADPSLRNRDPNNRLFARQSQFRLDAELVRDNALAISGLLSKKMFGRSVKPYQPANYWYRLYKEAKYAQDHGEDLYRRGVYTYWRRSFWHPSLQAFDAPAREECVAERPRSNTPQQALVLLNDPTYVEAARALAEQMIQHGGKEIDGRIHWAYQRALARPAHDWEIKEYETLKAKFEARYSEDEASVMKLLSVGERPLPKDVSTNELAVWTNIARVVLNLHETITRS